MFPLSFFVSMSIEPRLTSPRLRAPLYERPPSTIKFIIYQNRAGNSIRL